MNFNAKIYVKRLSNPPNPVWNKYALWQNTLFASAGADNIKMADQGRGYTGRLLIVS